MSILKRDIKNIFYKGRILFVLYLLVLILCQVTFISAKDFGYSAIDSFFNSIAFDVGPITNFETFHIPTFWLLFQLISTFIVLFTVYSDHVENGSYNILKTKSRSKYFISKVLAGFFVILIMNLALYLLVFLNTLLSSDMNSDSLMMFTRIICSYVVVQFILYLIGFLISILAGFKFGLSSILVQLALSMTTNFKYFIGQQSLIYKQDILGGYISLKDCLITWGVYLVVAILVSYFVFRSYDFCGGKND